MITNSSYISGDVYFSRHMRITGCTFLYFADKEAERLSLNARFPTTEWDNAKDYFKKKEDMA